MEYTAYYGVKKMYKLSEKRLKKNQDYKKKINRSIFYDNIVKNTVFKRDKVCVKCGSNEKLIVHHKRYGVDITINDLKVLCKKCHNKEHEKARRDYEKQLAKEVGMTPKQVFDALNEIEENSVVSIKEVKINE